MELILFIETVFFYIFQKSLSIDTSTLLNEFFQIYPKPAHIEKFLNTALTYFKSISDEKYIFIFSSSEEYSRYYYTNAPNLNIPHYIIAFFNNEYFQIHIKINPCKGLKEYCCENQFECDQENSLLVSKGDLEVAYVTDRAIPKCKNEFSKICGTFLEIHTPNNEIILETKIIDSEYFFVYKTMFLSTKNLCAGRYEIWMVMKIRGNNYLIYTKPFYIKIPSCTCEEVKYHGYSC